MQHDTSGEEATAILRFETLASSEFVGLTELSRFVNADTCESPVVTGYDEALAFLEELDRDTEQWEPQVRPAAQPRRPGVVVAAPGGGARRLLPW